MSGRVLNADLAELMDKVSDQCALIVQKSDVYGHWFAERIEKRIELPLKQLRAEVAEHCDGEDGESISRLIEVVEKLQDDGDENASIQEDLVDIIGRLQDDGDENAKIQEELVASIERMREELENVNQKYDASLKTLSEQRKTKEQETLVFQRQVRRQLDDLRRLVAHSSGPGQSAPGFPQFSRFPPELRHMVWHAAVPRRLYCADRDCGDVSFALSVPAIAHVCRESRRVALSLGRLWRMGPGRNPGWSWYTPDRDIFLMRDMETSHMPHRAIEELAIEPPEHWAHPYELLGEYFSRRLALVTWGVPDVFPNLHTVYVLFRKPTLVDKSWNPAVVSKLFGGDSVVVVDLSDAAALSRIQQLLCDDCPGYRLPEEDDVTCPGVDERYREHGSLALRDLDFATRAVNRTDIYTRARHRLLKKYMLNKASWTPLTREYAQLWDGDMSPNMEIPWVRDTVNSLRIRPVIIFALLDGRPYTGAQGPKWGNLEPDE